MGDFSMNKSVILMGYKVETMDIDGIIYFPCKICKRLFKDEKLTIEHLQKCKPRIYLVANEELNRKKSENVTKDPYEIIPEEMDMEDRTVNDNSDCNRNVKELSGKKYRRYNKNNIEYEKQIEFIKTKNSHECSSVVNQTIPKKKRCNNRKRLSDEEIEERLRKISESLKKHAMKKSETGKEQISEKRIEENDDDDDDEYSAIEEKLVLLNNDSMQHHNVKLNNDKLNVCKICGKVFTGAMELLKHSRNHTYPKIIMAASEIEKMLTIKNKSYCPICQKPLNASYKSVYTKHLQTHCFGIEHQCSICKKKFKRRDHMKAHEKRHIVVC